MVYQLQIYVCMHSPGYIYMPRVGSRQASLNKLIWCTLLCYLLCSGDKIHTFTNLIIPVLFLKYTVPKSLKMASASLTRNSHGKEE